MNSKFIRIIIFVLLAFIVFILPSFFSPKEVNQQIVDAATPLLTPFFTPTVTATSSPTPTVSPSPTPTSEPTPEPIAGVDVVTYYRNEIPEDLKVNLLYDSYTIHMDYIVALGYIRIREKPDSESERLRTIKFGDRVKLREKVLGLDGESHWYRVSYTKKGTEYIGFIAENARYASERIFQVEKMLSRVKNLQKHVEGADTVYISNFRNVNGWPPRVPGRKIDDEYGYVRAQATAGYIYPGKDATFRYIPDGMLAIRLYEGYKYTQVYIPTFDYKCWVPNKNVSEEPKIEYLKQVIVVDRKNQNCGIFQYNGQEWELISLSFVTTGKPGEFSLVTPLGDFMAIQRKTKFSYTADGTDEIVGYAPYVIRFSGGGYVHGVPMKYPDLNDKSIFDLDGREALSSLGTVPRSHMCIRNYTSHAKFLYEWVDIGSAAVIVIE